MSKLIIEQGNLYKGSPYGVLVEKPFDCTELHGPFGTETQAWNYGMGLANESRGTGKSFSIVLIEIPVVKSIATTEEIEEHFAKDDLVTKSLGIAPGETKKIEID